MHKTLILTGLFSLAAIFAPLQNSSVSAADKKSNATTVGKKPKQPVYRLPKDPKTPMIVLDYRGGFTPPKISQAATLSIFPDGTVVIPKKFANTKAYKGKLSQGELQSLLHFIIGTNEFFKYDQATVVQEIQKEKQRIAAAGGAIFRLADAATVEIQVIANEKTNQATYYPSGIDESKIKGLKQRAVIQRRLQQVMSTVQLGGKAKVSGWLKMANDALVAQHPKAKPLTLDDFQSGAERANGSTYINFSRSKLGPNGKPVPNHLTNVFINRLAQGKAKINVVYRRPAGK
jgi:hypothetical protein